MRHWNLFVLICLTLISGASVLGCGGQDGEVPAGKTGEPAAESSPAASPEAPSSDDSRSSAEPSAEEASRLGPPLEHPERYYGLYANPETPNRQWFIIEAKRPPYAEQAPEVPPGHLALGAMFGDVEPWQMKTLSETEFEQVWVSSLQPEPVAIRFELDDAGNAIALSFTDEQTSAEGRLERVGDLPEDFQ